MLKGIEIILCSPCFIASEAGGGVQIVAGVTLKESLSNKNTLEGMTLS